MDERVARIIATTATIENLRQLEVNARERGALDNEMSKALNARSGVLGRVLVAQMIGRDLTHLTSAEEKIVQAISEYVGIKRREGSNASRTISQVRNRGLIGAAEVSVMKSQPTQGFTALADADREDLSYEKIVVDHPGEFSARALWHARRTLNLPNDSERPPPHTSDRPLVEPNSIVTSETPYWVFVCNPKKWAVDRFLLHSIEHDSWGVRPSDRNRFAPGQLGIVRVGVDRRSAVERDGKPPLEAGIYALCEVESEAFASTGANDEFWAVGEAREPGWPTVKLRYLRTYLDQPLSIEKLRAELPGISPLLLNGFQAASFPVPAEDFRQVVGLLGGIPDDDLIPSTDAVDFAAEGLAALEQKYLHAAPEVKYRLSKVIERGQIGALVKRANGFKCQICEALGDEPIGFREKSGDPYVEAHHVMPVSKREIGSLAASNVMTVCANHHRQMHYGGIDVTISPTSFEFEIEGMPVKTKRLEVPARLQQTRAYEECK